jgi:hypothetical protein
MKYGTGAMMYAFTQDVPIDAAFYRRITDGLGDEPSEGLIAHIAVERLRAGFATSTYGSLSRTGTASPRSGFTPSCTVCSARCSATSCPQNPSARRWPSSTCGSKGGPAAGAQS